MHRSSGPSTQKKPDQRKRDGISWSGAHSRRSDSMLNTLLIRADDEDDIEALAKATGVLKR